MLTLLFLLLFFGLLAAGMPIFLVLGMCAGILYIATGQPLIGAAQMVINKLNSTTLMALPLFVMAAAFMRSGGVAKALVDVATAWLGGIRGSLGLVTVVACTLFAAICGSSVATALAMGTILVPAMIERGYPRSFALGVVGASGTIGIVVPPSLALILYGIVAEQSVPRLFLAGVLPGLLQAAAFALWVLYYARRHNFPVEPTLPLAERLRVTGRAIPALAVPLVVTVGIYGGVVTVTEAAALSAAVALLVSLIFYRGFHWTQTLTVITDGIRSAGTIMLIVATALAFGHWMTEFRNSQSARQFRHRASFRDVAVPADHQRAVAGARMLPRGHRNLAAGAADPGAGAGAARRRSRAFLDHLHAQHGDRVGSPAGRAQSVCAVDHFIGADRRGDPRHPAVPDSAADRARDYYLRADPDAVVAQRRLRLKTSRSRAICWFDRDVFDEH